MSAGLFRVGRGRHGATPGSEEAIATQSLGSTGILGALSRMTAAGLDRDQTSSPLTEVSTTSRRLDAEMRVAGLAEPLSYAVTRRLISSGLNRFFAARQPSQSGHIADDHHVALNKSDVLAGQPAQHAIDMRAGEAEVIADLLLRQVQIECRASDQSAAPQPVSTDRPASRQRVPVLRGARSEPPTLRNAGGTQ